MSFCFGAVRLMRGFPAVIAIILASAAPSQAAPDVTTANARIENGKLVIDGMTELGSTKIRLDGKTTAGFTVTSNQTTKAFKFNVTYYPSDCVVTLQKVTGNTLGPATNWTVNNCGSGVAPRGAWSSATQYLKDDLVTFGGSSWRARRNNLNVTPVAGADWEKFLLQGPAGPPGPAGLTARGVWSNATSYAAGDIVQRDGTTWRAKRANSNVTPGSSASDWEALAQKGGQGATGVVDLATLGWSAFLNLPPNASDFVFIGDPGAVALTATQQISGSASASMSMPSGSGVVVFALCYKRGSDPIRTFGYPYDRTNSGAVTIDTATYSTSAADIPGAPGIYTVGLCARQPVGSNMITVAQVTGWVVVTNPPPVVCGDGAVRGNEQCDDGNGAGGDGCSAACLVEANFACSGQPSACGPICGNSLVESPEQCDDGGTTPGDGCSATCTTEAHYSCSGEPSVCSPICGDGIITLNSSEQCDDGDTVSGNGCSSSCAIEIGFYCSSEPSFCQTLCGDGVIGGPESCDDANSDSGDGCSISCAVESGYDCTGEPSICVPH